MIRLIVCGIACAALGTSAAAQVSQVVTTTDSTGKVSQVVTTNLQGSAAANAQAGAQSAQIAAATAAVPGSGLSPSTSLSGSNAGLQESTLLSVVAMRSAAHYMSTLQPAAGGATLLVVGGSAQTLDTSAWTTFNGRVDQISSNLDNDRKTVTNDLSPGAVDIKVIGVAIALAPKILSYFYTNYQIAGVSIPVDDYLMDVALLERGGWRLYSQSTNAEAVTAIQGKLDGLQTSINESTTLLVQALNEEVVLSNDPSAKAKLATLTKDTTALSTDLASAASFMNSFAGASTTPSNLAPILQAWTFNKALQKDQGGVAFVKAHFDVGGVITKTNLFTNLGAMPMYNSVTLVVSYVYYAGGNDGQKPTKTAIFEVVTPYHTAPKVMTLLKLDQAGSCDEPSLPDAKKYCPTVYATSSP